MKSTEDLIDIIIADWHKIDADINTKGTEVIGRIVRLSTLIARQVDANLANYEMNTGEFDVLAALLRAHKHELAPFELHGLMLVSSGGLSNRLKALEKKGLIRRAPARFDGRGVLVRLTKVGKVLIEEVAATHLALENSLIESLTATDAESLQHLLNKLLVALDDE